MVGCDRPSGSVTSQVHISPFSLTSSSDTRRSLAGSASALSRTESWVASSTESGADLSGAQTSAVGTGSRTGSFGTPPMVPRYRCRSIKLPVCLAPTTTDWHHYRCPPILTHINIT
jgi:hypothetical protein